MDADPLSRTFAALADPTRRAILARLAQGSATVKELSAPFNMSGPAISKHLRVLERAGLISQGREAQRRPRRLEAASIKAVADWSESYRQFWEESFDRLGDYLEVLQGRQPASKQSAKKASSPRRKGSRRARPRRSTKRGGAR
ncbi:MAG: metalloregulator ArsR/SmtB family transcription factor [Polyangiaceae bacterium]